MRETHATRESRGDACDAGQTGATPNQGSNSLGSSSLKRAALPGALQPPTCPAQVALMDNSHPLNRLDFRENAKIFACDYHAPECDLYSL